MKLRDMACALWAMSRILYLPLDIQPKESEGAEYIAVWPTAGIHGYNFIYYKRGMRTVKDASGNVDMFLDSIKNLVDLDAEDWVLNPKYTLIVKSTKETLDKCVRLVLENMEGAS